MFYGGVAASATHSAFPEFLPVTGFHPKSASQTFTAAVPFGIHTRLSCSAPRAIRPKRHAAGIQLSKALYHKNPPSVNGCLCEGVGRIVGAIHYSLFTLHYSLSALYAGLHKTWDFFGTLCSKRRLPLRRGIRAVTDRPYSMNESVVGRGLAPAARGTGDPSPTLFSLFFILSSLFFPLQANANTNLFPTRTANGRPYVLSLFSAHTL